MTLTKSEQFLVDLAERVISTFLQAFLAALLTTSAVTDASTNPNVHVSWLDAAMIGLLAAVVSALTTLLVWLTDVKAIENPYVDLVYRVVVTFVQTLLGYLVAAGTMSALDFNWNAALLAAAVAAGAALLKALIGLNAASRGVSVIPRPDARHYHPEHRAAA